MPFTKVGPNDYVSPSGRHWTKSQVRLYHATGGFKTKKRTKEMTYDRLSAADILAEERARIAEAWGPVARAASAASRSLGAAGKAGVAGERGRIKSYAAAQGRAKARGIASAVPVPKKGGKGKKPPKPKRIKVNVGKAAYNKVNAFGKGRQRAVAYG